PARWGAGSEWCLLSSRVAPSPLGSTRRAFRSTRRAFRSTRRAFRLTRKAFRSTRKAFRLPRRAFRLTRKAFRSRRKAFRLTRRAFRLRRKDFRSTRRAFRLRRRAFRLTSRASRSTRKAFRSTRKAFPPPSRRSLHHGGGSGVAAESFGHGLLGREGTGLARRTRRPSSPGRQAAGGLWFDRTQEYGARRRGEEHERNRFAAPETVTLSPLPCWERLSPEDQK